MQNLARVLYALSHLPRRAAVATLFLCLLGHYLTKQSLQMKTFFLPGEASSFFSVLFHYKVHTYGSCRTFYCEKVLHEKLCYIFWMDTIPRRCFPECSIFLLFSLATISEVINKSQNSRSQSFFSDFLFAL